MKLKKLLYSKFYLRSFFSIIALMVLFLILVAVFFWTTSISQQREAAETEAQNSLAKAQAQISEKLSELLHIVLEIEADNSFTYSPVMGRTQAKKTLIQSTLDRYVSCNAFISDIAYESLLDTENIFSSRGRYSKEMYDKYVYSFAPDFDRAAFDQQRTEQALSTIPVWHLRSILHPVPKLAFVYSLPIMSGNPLGFVTFYIEKQSLDAIFENLLTEPFDNVYLLENDRLVYSYAGGDQAVPTLAWDAAALQQQNGFVYARRSLAVSNWEFIARWSNASVYGAYYANRLFFVLLLLSALLVIILSSAMVALRNYAPLGQVLAKYRDLYQNDAGNLREDDLLILESIVDDEIAQRKRLARQLYLSNLIWNQYEDMDGILQAAHEADVAFPYPSFLGCAILYEGQNLRADAWLEQIEESLDLPGVQCYGTQIHCQPMLYLVVNMDEAQVDMAALEKAMAGSLIHEGVISASLGISARMSSLSDSLTQYQQAAHAAREGLLLGQRVMRFASIALVGEHPQFLLAQRRMGDALRKGDGDKALAAWQGLRDMAATDEKLQGRQRYVAYRMLDYLINHLCNDLPTQAQEHVDAYRRQLVRPSPLGDYAQSVEALLPLIAAHAPVDSPQEDTLLKRILQCIESNYRDNALSLEHIAVQCNISSSYLVRYFKGKTGDTPMQYVDSKRMNHAKNLLTETNLSLHEVTHQSGYLDESNFARKFKKLYGCTPMNHRKHAASFQTP